MAARAAGASRRSPRGCRQRFETRRHPRRTRSRSGAPRRGDPLQRPTALELPDHRRRAPVAPPRASPPVDPADVDRPPPARPAEGPHAPVGNIPTRPPSSAISPSARAAAARSVDPTPGGGAAAGPGAGPQGDSRVGPVAPSRPSHRRGGAAAHPTGRAAGAGRPSRRLRRSHVSIGRVEVPRSAGGRRDGAGRAATPRRGVSSTTTWRPAGRVRHEQPAGHRHGERRAAQPAQRRPGRRRPGRRLGQGHSRRARRGSSVRRPRSRTSLNLFLYQVTPNQGWRNERAAVAYDSNGTPGHQPAARARPALPAHRLRREPTSTPRSCSATRCSCCTSGPVLDRAAIRTALDPSPLGPSILPPAFPALAASDLADQVESVKITPRPGRHRGDVAAVVGDAGALPADGGVRRVGGADRGHQADRTRRCRSCADRAVFVQPDLGPPLPTLLTRCAARPAAGRPAR